MSVQFRSHQGVEILYIDYSNAKSQPEMINILLEAEQIYLKSSSKIRSLSNMTGVFIGLDLANEMKRMAPGVFREKGLKSAIIGIDDLKAILIKSFNSMHPYSQLEICADEKEALAYLIG